MALTLQSIWLSLMFVQGVIFIFLFSLSIVIVPMFLLSRIKRFREWVKSSSQGYDDFFAKHKSIAVAVRLNAISLKSLALILASIISFGETQRLYLLNINEPNVGLIPYSTIFALWFLFMANFIIEDLV